MHDAVTGRDHVDIFEGRAGPVDEIEAVGIAAVLYRAVLVESLRVEAGVLNRQRVINDELGRHHRVYARRVAALLGDRVAQAGEIDQCGLAEDVVTDHTRRVPREIEAAAALDDLPQRFVEVRSIAAAHQVFGQHACRVRQAIVCSSCHRLDRGVGIEVVQLSAGQWFTVLFVHRLSLQSSSPPWRGSHKGGYQ